MQHSPIWRLRLCLGGVMLWVLASIALAGEEEGVFVRFRMTAPEGVPYYVKLGGYTHVPNWRLPDAIIPAGADRTPGARLAAGEYTAWFDLKAHAGKLLHPRQNRAGGTAEYPNVTVDFLTDPPD